MTFVFASVPLARTLLRLSLAAALVAPLAACSSIGGLFGGEKYKTEIVADVPAPDLYDQGLVRLQKGDSKGAAKSFADLEKQYPSSDWSRKGLLMTTYAQYQGGAYTDSVASGTRFVGLYPNAPDAPYALYLTAMSHYNQVPDITRDQEESYKALQAFGTLVQKYPKSEYVEDSKYKISVMRDQLAGKEMSVGRYYLTRRNYTAAINRFRVVLGQYQTTRHTEEALYRLTEAYIGLGIPNEAQTAAAVLGHNFPDSPWYKDAYSILQGGGFQPNEDQGSWISRAFRGVGLG